MIDLRFPDLPSQIECDGIFYDIRTDFRVWIEFEYQLREHKRCWHGIFKDKMPNSTDWVFSAIEFLQSKNATPHVSDSSGVRALDYILDGDYIVAAFQQAYNIDLTSIEYLHWHRFNALMNGLPDETKLSKIMGYRLWKPTNKDTEAQMRELRSTWALPDPEQEQGDKELLQWADDMFG